MGYICLNKTVRLFVDGRPEGPTLKTLLDALEEFLEYHKKIDDSAQRDHGGSDRKANFVGRLQALTDELRMFA